MADGRMPLYLTTFVLVLFCAALMQFQPYSADWPGTAYAGTARQFIRAAIAGDSVGLSRLSASSEPVTWALNAARAHGRALALWGRRPEAWTGAREGDTAEVFVFPGGDECRDAPLVFRFVGAGRNLRVAQARSDCIDP